MLWKEKVSVVHKTAKHVISRHGKNESGSELYKKEKQHVQSAHYYCFLSLNMQIGDSIVSPFADGITKTVLLPRLSLKNLSVGLPVARTCDLPLCSSMLDLVSGRR